MTAHPPEGARGAAPMRVAVVNDLRIAAEALRRVLSTEADLALAWTAKDGAEALAHCVADPPDLVLMDLVMPVMDGVEATRRIMKEAPCPIVVVTATVDGNLSKVYDALAAGALDAVNGPTFAPDGLYFAGVDYDAKWKLPPTRRPVAFPCG